MESSNNPLVSVLIPVWGDYLKYLPRCLASVNKQTYENIEIIVVESETSVPKAINKGIELAEGKYITHVGADDTLYPSKIEKQVKVMEKYPFYSLCACWLEDTRFNMKRVGKIKPIVGYTEMLKAFNYSSGSTYMWRKKYNERYDESLPSGQDYDFALKLAKHGLAACIPEVLVKQFSTPGQISTNWGKKIRGIYILAKKYGEDYSIVDWMKVAGLLGLYFSAYFLGIRVYKFITYAKEKYE